MGPSASVSIVVVKRSPVSSSSATRTVQPGRWTLQHHKRRCPFIFQWTLLICLLSGKVKILETHAYQTTEKFIEVPWVNFFVLLFSL
jgi:hypothetical protein